MATQFLQQLLIVDSNSKQVVITKVPEMGDVRLGLMSEDPAKHIQLTQQQAAALVIELQYFVTNGYLRQTASQV